MRRSILYILASFLLYSPSLYSRQPLRTDRPFSDTTKQSCQQTATRLLEEALTFMQKNYYRKESIDWKELAIAAKGRLPASCNCEDAYNAIGWCFSQLNEAHSFLMPPGKAATYNCDTAQLTQMPPLSKLVGEIKGEWLQDSIAYLTIPWVSTTDSLICMQIADSLQELIARLDSRNVSKWIIDLRKNTGGNCWPMLAGIGPLLGNGVCGYFISANEKIPITYRDGAALQGRHVLCRVSNNHYETRSLRKSIILLTGPRTISAGEIVALAFRGKEEAYFYGQPTAGLTTANATYTLSDHSMLVLTVCQEADRTGKICAGSIIPDKYIANNTLNTQNPQDADPAKSEALRWLQTH